VNLSADVYHKDGSFYGTTKHEKFMTEDEATNAGNGADGTRHQEKTFWLKVGARQSWAQARGGARSNSTP
jgi:hypothetical protein